MERPAKILIVDDEKYTRIFLNSLLKEENYDTKVATGGYEALEFVAESEFDLMLLDLKMPQIDGLSVLKLLKTNYPNLPVIIMTAFATIQTAVESIKLGAANYLTKPFEDHEAVKIIVRNVIEQKLLVEENILLRKQLLYENEPNKLIFVSPQMQEVMNLIEKISAFESTVLITGETGTGKEVIARIIHNSSPRSLGKFLAVNCAGIPETLLESTLFGYEKGAFTGAAKTTKGYFEEAEGGTIYLDEIGDTSLNLQVRLLRVLEEKKVARVGGTNYMDIDVRIIAATNKNLEEEITRGNFREDLFYRLNVIDVELSPLRERFGDISLLAKTFLARFCKKFDKEIKGFSPEALQMLEKYAWKGNVRELINVLERVVALEDSPYITIESLPDYIAKNSANQDLVGTTYIREGMPPFNPNYKIAQDNFHRSFFVRLLSHAKGNVSRAAELSGIGRQNLYLKLKKYDLNPDDYRN
jgi:DNA-binding NtrC family response regulator